MRFEQLITVKHMPSLPTPQTQRLFIGFAIPERVKAACQEAIRPYQKHLKGVISPQRWHITLLFLGECTEVAALQAVLIKPIPQAYLPTITLTHIGKGLAEGQLWVSALPTVALQQLEKTVRARLVETGLKIPGLMQSQDFAPHIHVADLEPNVPSLIVDKPLQVTFVPRELHLFRSEILAEDARVYTSQARIPLLA